MVVGNVLIAARLRRPPEKKPHDDIVALVEEMLQLQKEHAAAARDKFAEQVEALQRRIDQVDAATARPSLRALTKSCIGCMI